MERTIDEPEHLRRYPTAEAIKSLARRFDLPIHDYVQDWEYQVADASRIGEFLSAYEDGELTEDERFVLMETILQSFEDLDEPLDQDANWQRVLTQIDRNIELHIYSVWYWACLDAKHRDESWSVSPYMRDIFDCHQQRFETSSVE